MLNCALASSAIFLAISGPSAHSRIMPVLFAGRALSADLVPGQSHLYRVKASGAFRLELDQMGADFALDALDAKARTVRTIDAFGWGTESASFAGETPVSFVRVRRADNEKFTASFALSLIPLAGISPGDDLRARAEDAATKARSLTRDHGAANLRDAVSAASKAAELWKETGDRGAYLRASLALADALNSSVGAFEEARAIYDAAMALSRQLGDIRSEAECLNNRGVSFRRQALYQEALDDLRPALDLWRKLPVQTGFAATLNNLALLETDRGDYQGALGHYAEARGLLARLGNKTGRAFVENNLALIQGRLGNSRASIRSFESAATTFEAHGNGLAAGRALTNSARMYLRIGDPARAESNVRRGLALIAPAHDDRATAEGLNLLGEVYAAKTQFPEAASCFHRALDLARQSGDRLAQANALMNLGLESSAISAHAEGVAFLEDSRQLFAKIGTPASEATVLYHLALAYSELGDLARAKEMAEGAVTIAEKLRGTVAAEELRVSFLASTHDYYFALVDILMRRGETAEAWQVADRARARALLESVSGGSRSIEEQKLVRQLNANSLKLSRDSPDAEAVRKRVEILAAELSGVRSRDAGLELLPVPNVAEVQQKLGADTALIEYALGDSGSYAWVFTGNSFRWFRLPGSGTISVDATRVATLLNAAPSARFEDSAFRRAAGSLSSALMIPALTADLHVRRLVIVPDGPLDLVPFEVLPAPPTRALIENYEMVESPSVAVALALGRRRAGRTASVPRGLALVGDPVFDAGDVRLGPHVSGSREPARFSRLAFSRREAHAIAALGPPSPVAMLLDFDASKELFTSGRLADYGVLNISTHGVAGARDTSQSGLVLSLVDHNGSPRDGMLSVSDVANLHLSADVVVLSACNTASGRRFAGEGSLSLARAFLYAGADRVIAARFQIDDEAAAALLTAFYESMWRHDGLMPSAALRQAQLALRRDPRWRSPFYWASFVLQGEP
jgi:CHAT domain-containing protein/tetratricopeptide (TPR) repeat protein